MPAAPANDSSAAAEDEQRLARATRRALVVGAAVIVVASGVAATGGLAPGEKAVFEAINGLPAAVATVLWPVVQLGSILLLPALAMVAYVLRDGRLAMRIGASGFGAWVLAELGKAVVDRPRPGALLEGVHLHGEASSGAGFPSGHTAVGAALAVALVAIVPRRWWPGLALLPILIGLGRMASGVHLPLDVVGGAAIGVAVGIAVDAITARVGRTT